MHARPRKMFKIKDQSHEAWSEAMASPFLEGRDLGKG